VTRRKEDRFPCCSFLVLSHTTGSSFIFIFSAPVFEPIVNAPALGSFIVIVVVFSLLQMRIRAVEEAVERRKAALVQLRAVKSKELSSVGDERPDANAVAAALREYEDALRGEENMRTLLPGVQIVAPNRPAATSAEDVIAAKQFLGIDLDPARNEGKEERMGWSAGSIAVLAVVALSQLALLYMLSFDPMESYGFLGGNTPPSS
jgi:hypothetical protein